MSKTRTRDHPLLASVKPALAQVKFGYCMQFHPRTLTQNLRSLLQLVVETESSARLRNPPKSSKSSGLKFKSTTPANKGRPPSPPQRRSPSPDRRRSPSPARGRARYSRSPSRSRSPIRQKRTRSTSRSLSPYAARNRRSPSPRSRSRSRSPDREAGFGLQTAEQVKREMMRQKEKEQSNRMRANSSSGGGEAETIYRDVRGINILIGIYLFIR